MVLAFPICFNNHPNLTFLEKQTHLANLTHLDNRENPANLTHLENLQARANQEALANLADLANLFLAFPLCFNNQVL